MNNSIVYNLQPIDRYTFDSIDCFVCAVHGDERAVEGASKLLSLGISIEHVIIIKYDCENGLNRIREQLNSCKQEILISNDIYSFIKNFKEAVRPYINKRVVIDISCIRIPEIFSIMKILQINNHIQHIPCIYSVPFDYDYYAGDFSYKSSIGDLQNYELAGFGGEYDSDNRNATYIVFLGFEGALSLKVLEEAEYKHLDFVNSLPSHYQKYKDISILNNRSSIKGKQFDTLRYVPADNPFEVYNFLEKIYAEESSFCIAPLATKPIALGVCLFALSHEKVRIVYPISDNYSQHSSDRVAKTIVYDIIIGD